MRRPLEKPLRKNAGARPDVEQRAEVAAIEFSWGAALMSRKIPPNGTGNPGNVDTNP